MLKLRRGSRIIRAALCDVGTAMTLGVSILCTIQATTFPPLFFIHDCTLVVTPYVVILYTGLDYFVSSFNVSKPVKAG